MDKTVKETLVREYHSIFADAGVIVVSHYKGLTMPQMDILRNDMKAQGGKFRVVKNRLVQRALAKTTAEPLSDLFEGPTALAWSDDPVAAPKILAKFAKDNDMLVLRGGIMGETVLDAAAVHALASLPSLDESRAQLIGLLQAPMQKLLRLMQEPAGQMARLVKQKPETAGAPAADAAGKDDDSAEVRSPSSEDAPAKDEAPKASDAAEAATAAEKIKDENAADEKAADKKPEQSDSSETKPS